MAPKTLREAFYKAAESQLKLIAAEAFTYSLERSQVEVSRRLGPRADRAPTWDMLEAILKFGQADPLLDYFAERYRKRWEDIPDLPSVLRQRSIAEMRVIKDQLDLVFERLEHADEMDAEDAEVLPLRPRNI